jgi:hypothetical protein
VQSSIAMWDVFPAGPAAPDAERVGAAQTALMAAAEALAGAALDAAELLDVDVHELAGTLALVAARRLEPEPAELAHPDPGQDPRHRRERHPQQLGDLRTGEAQPAQRRDRRDALLARA